MFDLSAVPARRRALLLATAALLALTIYCLISLGGGGGAQQAGAQVGGTSTSLLRLVDENGELIEGDSTLEGHAREIELRSWGFGVQNTGGLETTGKAQARPLTFEHGPNPSWPRLFAASAGGKRLGEAVLTVMRTSGDRLVEYLVYRLKPVFVAKVEDTSSGGAPAQAVTVTYGTATVSYKPSEDPDGSPITGGWDFITDTEP